MYWLECTELGLNDVKLLSKDCKMWFHFTHFQLSVRPSEKERRQNGLVPNIAQIEAKLLRWQDLPLRNETLYSILSKSFDIPDFEC